MTRNNHQYLFGFEHLKPFVMPLHPGVNATSIITKLFKMNFYQGLIWGQCQREEQIFASHVGFHVWPLTPSCPCVRSRPFEEQQPLQFPEVATWFGQLLTIEPSRTQCGHAWHNSHRNLTEMKEFMWKVAAVWTGRLRIWIVLPGFSYNVN